jgi:hypothetical protein
MRQKKAYVLLLTSFVILFMSLSIGVYIKYATASISHEFHKDLAKIRGYWAVYGAKETNSAVGYPYFALKTWSHTSVGADDGVYDINTTVGSDNNFTWQITNDANSFIKNDSVYRRTLRIIDSNSTESYRVE